MATLAPHARAGVDAYCSANVGGFGHCTAPQHSLTDNAVVGEGSNRVCAGAQIPGGAFYGSYFCASSSACHDYSGSNLLEALAHNGQSGAQVLNGLISYGVDSLTGCPRGS